MEGTFTINEFIEHRWGEARATLCCLDPAFVTSLEGYGSLLDRGFALPDTLPLPTKRLPKKWHRLLETTMDVVQEVQRLQLTVSLLEGEDSRRLARYHFETWVQSGYNLCEKLKVLATYSCAVSELGNKTKDRYRKAIETVQNTVGKNRQALVHGVDDPSKGGRGITAEAITGDGLWEPGVVLGPKIIQVGIDAAYAEDDQHRYLPAKEYYNILKQTTEVLLNKVGDALSPLDKDIINARGGDKHLANSMARSTLDDNVVR